ncbi:acetate/propionate family kinase [Teichococcus cervicalis]|uniref:Acetate kinase n=1 Tax=Pseudoroseomonas cervicalis ATCC 49957 TaxID=525371 RepID=D5RJN5_9PROT|nr:acetate/propionate family kinase [Pseudoroseomonas cervicalis]EFH12481.1 acetate kinase [Pseudoroseomonas cervicalis ATCC 49957]
MSGRAILVLNAGSSSIKFQLYDEAGGALTRRFKGRLEGIGTARPRLLAWAAGDVALEDRALDPARTADGEAAQAALGGWIADHMGGPPDAVGHRVVHGGGRFTGPALVDDTVLAELTALVPLAPLHQPHNLAPIRSIRARRPDLPQVACFDTAFHATLPELARRFAIPERLHAEGVRRYGFHGLSYEYISSRLPELAPEIAGGRVVVLHLGSGASACAMRAGRSVESTMGFTALDGLPMGTRPGLLDAGVVLYLAQQGRGAAEIEHILYHESGLRGLSGLSGDVRDLLASDAPAARLALDYFAYRTAQSIAALASALGGLDGLVFTAGVGENAAPVRAMIAERCAWLGIRLDPAANAAHAPRIHAPGSLPVHIIPTNEERMVARHVLDMLGAAP